MGRAKHDSRTNHQWQQRRTFLKRSSMPLKKAKKTSGPTKVESLRHKDKRTNIPTEELSGFVAVAESSPPYLVYPRDPSLDPQLVWKGKDEQDRKDLEVPAVPIYIQEKIQPRAIIENLRDTARAGEPEPELTLFNDFNGIEFEQLVEFYQHEQNWSNRMILGDSLLVMTSLAEKEGLKGKVQMIYVDPPYGIKFGSNWQVSTRKRDVKDGKVEDATRQPEQVRAFRDTWELGIHSYLSYLRDRLTVARELLTESGSIFVQIGDENVHLVRSVLDEVFGSENFCSQIPFRKTTGKASGLLDNTYDVLLWYARDRSSVKYRVLYQSRRPDPDVNWRFVEFPDGSRRPLSRDELDGRLPLPDGAALYRLNPLTSQSASETTLFRFELDGRSYEPGKGGWKTNLSGMAKLSYAGRLVGVGNTLTFVRYFKDFPFQTFNDIWDDTRQSGFGDPKVYVVQTASRVVDRCLLMTTDPGDLVLDPTCGSGTTAYVAEQTGRRWITIDTSRVAITLARTRLMAARYPYYLLADSLEGRKKEAELTGSYVDGPTDNDVRKGFVYERVAHVTLKSIANNADIKEGMTRQEIDAAVARHTETEVLFDRPYEDPKRIRVTGPFTVESLSPHRVLATDEERPASEEQAETAPDAGGFEQTILENLRKAGVQNTKRDERLEFSSLEPFAGLYLQAVGESKEGKRIAVSIGPEHGTVGRDLIREAAKEAIKGIGFDMLLICGFAFDPYAAETARELSPAEGDWARATEGALAGKELRYGKLPVLLVRMNPDLAMGDELLKKTGTGNLFMVFGEPDVLLKEEAGKLTAEIRGLDVYDPTTGEIRSSTTDDIACWFIDTNYNGESFFVRHAYFTGDTEPYDKLKKALRADIDEAAWATLYSTVSRQFDRPGTGKIAVKVINHYGDEVLKVYDV
jgi:adenine-specific DNA-methyltransferase